MTKFATKNKEDNNIMKRIISIAVAALALLAMSAAVRDDFKANPLLCTNNYLAYPDKNLPALAHAPAGYEPFFINHYGRHGSRWLIDGGEYSRPIAMLEKGAQAGQLTKRGQEVLGILRQVYAASQGRLGELSDVGHEQHQGIARRMYRNFPQVFVDGAPVTARSTVVIRCILSMQNEVDVLASLNPRLNITTDASEATMYYMNYTDTVVTKLRADNRAAINAYKEKWVNPDHMLKRLFKDMKWARANVDDARAIMLDLFDVASNMQSHHEFEGTSLMDLFSKDDQYSVWRYFNVRWYYYCGETPLTYNRVDYMEANLLRNFIEDADRAVSCQGPAGASLRFGHESVVLPLCCLMGLNGADYRTADLETLDQHWQTYKIFPMAANVQFVYFRKPGSDDILVLPLLNEHAAALPVPTDMAPFYHWSAVREYYLNKLSAQPIVNKN